MTEATSTRLAGLIEKYKTEQPAERAGAHQAFDAKTSYEDDKKALQRISKAPQAGSKISTGDIHAEMAGIQLDLADLADQYGKLNVSFQHLIGAKKIYNIGDVSKIAFYSVLGRKGKVKEVKVNAAKRRGDSIEFLVDKMTEVLNEQYQKAVQGRDRAKTLQVENVAHMKNLDKKLIESIRGNYSTSADLAAAEQEVKKLEAELGEIDGLLESYENDIQKAKTAGSVDLVSKLVGEMSQALDIKYGVLDGRLAADGVVSEVRRSMLNHAEGVQSAKGAVAASKTNYQAINALIDAMNDLEIKYRHACEDMIPVFKIQGRIAAGGMQALEMRDTLVRVANASQRLMEANERLVTHLARETFELLQTPIYDVEKAKVVEARIKASMDELNQLKKDWAENQQRLTEQPSAPHYAQPR